MEITILKVEEFKGSLNVHVEHEYGKQVIGLGLHAKYLGDDGQPKFISEVKKLLEKQFGDRNEDKSLKRTELFEKFKNKKITLNKVEVEKIKEEKKNASNKR